MFVHEENKLTLKLSLARHIDAPALFPTYDYTWYQGENVEIYFFMHAESGVTFVCEGVCSSRFYITNVLEAGLEQWDRYEIWRFSKAYSLSTSDMLLFVL